VGLSALGELFERDAGRLSKFWAPRPVPLLQPPHLGQNINSELYS